VEYPPLFQDSIKQKIALPAFHAATHGHLEITTEAAIQGAQVLAFLLK
jgi:hypothetical protein